MFYQSFLWSVPIFRIITSKVLANLGKQNFISLLKNISVRTSFIFLAESLNKRLSQMKFIIFFLGISTFCFSQKFSFIYETKYKLNSENPDDVNSEKMILDLKDNISIFRDSVEKQADSSKLNNGKEIFKMGVENQFYVKKNLAQKRIEKVITYLGKDYLLPIEEILDWKITSEQKMIGKYQSQKAETTYGGRNWIAWFISSAIGDTEIDKTLEAFRKFQY